MNDPYLVVGFIVGLIFGLVFCQLIISGGRLLFVATLVLVLASDAAVAQQAIIYGADGRRIGTAQIDSQGTTTTRNAAGTVVARETLTDADRRIPHKLNPRACPFKSPCFEIPTY